MSRPNPSRPGVSLRLRWLVWGLYVLLWTSALLTPYPSRAAQVLVSDQQKAFISAKLVHVSAFAVFTILTGWLPVEARRRWLLLLFLSAHAAGTEYLQQFVPPRVGALLDVGLNHIGIVLGLIVSWGWWTARDV